ncbi:lipoyl domain-containing protein [Halopenitus sp. H-Gu1]|uniref:lipoyl domain-containing protein n=1 Tax=Halopenitus sp. H-Gu1 TaxID=3242697 RepID=UPI00359DA797
MSDADDRVAIDTADVWPEDADAEEAVVVNWFASEGSHVEAGENLLEFQIEKVSVDVPAPVSGTVVEIALPEDAEFERGEIAGWIRPE